MFHVFNAIWCSSPEIFPSKETTPFIFTYKVIPTGYQKGLFEAVDGTSHFILGRVFLVVIGSLDVLSYKDFDWQNWKYAENNAVVQHMINSAAGIFCSCLCLARARE